MSDAPRPQTPLGRPWLAIVGIGADGAASLSPAAREAVSGAVRVFGSERQLALVEALIHGRRLAWPSPLSQGLSRLFEQRGEPACVLASGDPFLYGIGATLAPMLARDEFVCYPAVSSLSLAAARLGWALQDTEVVSLTGRDLHSIIRHLQPGRRLLVLSSNGQTPRELARLLDARGFGASELTVFEELGAPSERRRSSSARDFQLPAIGDLNLIALELRAAAGSFVVPCRGGLPDSAFESDGQLTKREVRAITLSALEPRAGGRLWDIGAGSGSISIEWMLSHPSCRAIAIERDPERCERIRRNARALGVAELELISGSAPQALAELPPPDAVFIGGGALEAGLVERCAVALAPGGRLVINAVALETQARLLALHAERGGALCRISIEHSASLGQLGCLRPALSVLQWRLEIT